MASKVLDVRVDLGALKGIRGVTCGLLVGALVATVICLSVFAGKQGEINSNSPFEVCSLFFKGVGEPAPSTSICQYVIGGSATVLVLVFILLVETLSIVFFAFAFSEYVLTLTRRNLFMIFFSLQSPRCAAVEGERGIRISCADVLC